MPEPTPYNRSTKLAGARVRKETLADIDQQAEASGQTRTDWVRDAIMEKLARSCPSCGASLVLSVAGGESSSSPSLIPTTAESETTC